MGCGLGLGRGQEIISLLGVYTALSTEECDKWQGLIGCPALRDKCCVSEGKLAGQSAGLQECFGIFLLVIKSTETCWALGANRGRTIAVQRPLVSNCCPANRRHMHRQCEVVSYVM